MSCSCGRLKIGGQVTESRNWSPDCEVHGLESEWYRSDEQVAKRAEDSARLRDLQLRAREARAVHTLSERLRAIGELEDGPTFMGFPDRWWEAHTRRCLNDHVSTRVLKSEELGRDACLAAGCMAPVCLTFPEDVDGPLPARDIS